MPHKGYKQTKEHKQNLKKSARKRHARIRMNEAFYLMNKQKNIKVEINKS